MTRQEKHENLRKNMKVLCRMSGVSINALKRDAKGLSLKEKFRAIGKGRVDG